MADHRISIVMDEDDHKYLKIYCAKEGVTIKDFVIKCITEKIEELEDQKLFKNSFNNNDGENYVLIDHSGALHAV